MASFLNKRLDRIGRRSDRQTDRQTTVTLQYATAFAVWREHTSEMLLCLGVHTAYILDVVAPGSDDQYLYLRRRAAIGLMDYQSKKSVWHFPLFFRWFLNEFTKRASVAFWDKLFQRNIIAERKNVTVHAVYRTSTRDLCSDAICSLKEEIPLTILYIWIKPAPLRLSSSHHKSSFF